MRQTIFPVSVYHGVVPDNNLLKKMVIPFVEETKDSNKLPNWFTNKVITSFGNREVEEVLNNGNNPVGEELRKQYNKVLDSFFDDNYSVKFKGMWYNYYVDGEWQEQHDHLPEADVYGMTHFSCIHFLNYNQEIHNPVTFIDPLMNIRCHSFEMKSHNYQEKINPIINEGDLIMFPSYMPHEVKIGKPTPEYPRITISFNLQLMSYGENRNEN